MTHPDLTEAERELAQQLCVTSTATRTNAMRAIERCRSRGISAQQVLEYCSTRKVDAATALTSLGLMHEGIADPVPLLSAEEHAVAERLATETPASRADAFAIVERCRGTGVTASEVLAFANERGLHPADAFGHLFALEELAGRILSEPITEAERRAPDPKVTVFEPPFDPVPPALQPPTGGTLHLRAPKSKGERRLVAEIQKRFKARDAAMGQLARANRALSEAERALRQAGMVTGVTQAGPPPLPESEQP